MKGLFHCIESSPNQLELISLVQGAAASLLTALGTSDAFKKKVATYRMLPWYNSSNLSQGNVFFRLKEYHLAEKNTMMAYKNCLLFFLY